MNSNKTTPKKAAAKKAVSKKDTLEKDTLKKDTLKKDTKRVDFEAALEQLEALVTKLEEGDISLEESLQAFEQGIKLTRECQTQLTEAEQRVQMLVEEQGELTAVDFEEDDEDELEDEV